MIPTQTIIVIVIAMIRHFVVLDFAGSENAGFEKREHRYILHQFLIANMLAYCSIRLTIKKCQKSVPLIQSFKINYVKKQINKQ